MRGWRAFAVTALPAAVLIAAAQPALAADYRGVSADAAVLYDGPSERARKIYVVVRGTPLEVLSTVTRWVKVRDVDGDVLWIHGDDLGESRHVIVARALASVRRTAGEVGELLFQAERGVLLELVDDSAPAGWLHIRHRDGTVGYVSSSEVFGR